MRVVGLALCLMLIASSAQEKTVSGGGSSGSASVCSDSTPAPAAAWGYTAEVYCLNNISQVDVSNTGNPGYLLYTRIGWPGLYSGNTVGQTQSPTPGSWFTAAAGGGIQVLTTGSDSTNPGIDLTSCITNGTAGQWIGFTVTGPFYMKVIIGSAPSGRSGGSSGWWPVFPWTLPAEYYSAASPGVAHLTEFDPFETFLTDGSWFGNIIAWIPSPDWNSPVHSATDPFQRDQGGGGNHAGQVYGMLLVSPAQNAGTGFYAGYFAANTSTPETLNPTTPNTVTFTTGDQINEGLAQHNCVNVSSGSGQVTIIKSIQVWQAPPCATNTTFDFSNSCNSVRAILR
jgi:hypothetical protein